MTTIIITVTIPPLQIAHDHTKTLKFCLPLLVHVAVVLASHSNCPSRSRRQVVAFLAFACVGLTDSEDSMDCKSFLSQHLANAENTNGPVLSPEGISALVQVFKVRRTNKRRERREGGN